MHFDAEEIGGGLFVRDGDRRFAHAAADLEHDRRTPAEQLAEVERPRRVVDAEARPERGQRMRAVRATCDPGAARSCARSDAAAIVGGGAAAESRSVGRIRAAQRGPTRARPGAARAYAPSSRPHVCTRARACRRISTARSRRSTARAASTTPPCARRRASRARPRAGCCSSAEQKSAVAMRWRSGASFGSAGTSKLRPVARCSSTNDASSPCVA